MERGLQAGIAMEAARNQKRNGRSARVSLVDAVIRQAEVVD